MMRPPDLLIEEQDVDSGHILDGDGRLRPWIIATLLIAATAIAVVGQVQAAGLFGMGLPDSSTEAAWGWLGAKVPLCVIIWVIALQARGA